MFSLSYQLDNETKYFVAGHNQNKKRITLQKAHKGDNSQYVVFELKEGDVLLEYPLLPSEDKCMHVAGNAGF